jgi:oxysterol-binding protein-related protein 8
MKYELGDHAYVRCPETGMVADIEFKTKGYFSGGYNAIGGHIKDKSGKNLFELSGSWNEDMYIKDLTVCTKLELGLVGMRKQTADVCVDWQEGALL